MSNSEVTGPLFYYKDYLKGSTVSTTVWFSAIMAIGLYIILSLLKWGLGGWLQNFNISIVLDLFDLIIIVVYPIALILIFISVIAMFSVNKSITKIGLIVGTSRAAFSTFLMGIIVYNLALTGDFPNLENDSAMLAMMFLIGAFVPWDIIANTIRDFFFGSYLTKKAEKQRRLREIQQTQNIDQLEKQIPGFKRQFKAFISKALIAQQQKLISADKDALTLIALEIIENQYRDFLKAMVDEKSSYLVDWETLKPIVLSEIESLIEGIQKLKDLGLKEETEMNEWRKTTANVLFGQEILTPDEMRDIELTLKSSVEGSIEDLLSAYSDL